MIFRALRKKRIVSFFNKAPFTFNKKTKGAFLLRPSISLNHRYSDILGTYKKHLIKTCLLAFLGLAAISQTHGYFLKPEVIKTETLTVSLPRFEKLTEGKVPYQVFEHTVEIPDVDKPQLSRYCDIQVGPMTIEQFLILKRHYEIVETGLIFDKNQIYGLHEFFGPKFQAVFGHTYVNEAYQAGLTPKQLLDHSAMRKYWLQHGGGSILTCDHVFSLNCWSTVYSLLRESNQFDIFQVQKAPLFFDPRYFTHVASEENPKNLYTHGDLKPLDILYTARNDSDNQDDGHAAFWVDDGLVFERGNPTSQNIIGFALLPDKNPTIFHSIIRRESNTRLPSPSDVFSLRSCCPSLPLWAQSVGGKGASNRIDLYPWLIYSAPLKEIDSKMQLAEASYRQEHFTQEYDRVICEFQQLDYYDRFFKSLPFTLRSILYALEYYL